MGTGTIADPYTFAEAITIGANNIAPGDTLYLRGGTYSGGPLVCSISGTVKRRLTIRPHQNERVIVDGGFNLTGSYVTVKNIEFTDSTFTDRESAQASSNPSDINGTGGSLNPTGHGIKIVHCLIHDMRQGIAGSGAADDVEFYGNVIFYNGWKSVSNSYGHGIYNQNNGSTVRIMENNIVFDNFGYGFHCYASTGALNNIALRKNTAFSNGSLWGLWYNNILLGGSVPIDAPNLDSNATYYPWGVYQAGTNQVGYGANNPVTNASIYGNYLVGPDEIWGEALKFIGIAQNDLIRFDGNTLIGDFDGGAIDLDNWPGNVHLTELPGENQIFLIPSRHDSSRAHLTIYNWQLLDNVTIGVSSVFANGDTITARNVQDYWNDTQSLAVSGGNITINMQAGNRTVATPQGWTAPASTFPSFGAFVLEKL